MKPSNRTRRWPALALLLAFTGALAGCDPNQDLATNLTQFAQDLGTFFEDFARQLLAAALF